MMFSFWERNDTKKTLLLKFRSFELEVYYTLETWDSQVRVAVEALSWLETVVNGVKGFNLRNAVNKAITGQWHFILFCSNASFFLDFGFDWYFMLSLFKFLARIK